MDDDAAFTEQCRAAVERRLADLTPERPGRTRRRVDAALRRGRTTTRRRLDEATAILASIGLLNRAQGVIAGDTGLSEAVRADAGKDLGKDVRMTTLVSLLGVEGARAAVIDHLTRAEAAWVAAGARRRRLAPYVMRVFEARKAAA